jgi:hypothetical protein
MDAGVSRRVGLAAGVAAAAFACTAALVFSADSASSRADGDLLKPDLVVQRPYELYVSSAGREIRLRVSNTVANRGAGPLELTGGEDNAPCDGGDGRVTRQRIFEDTGDADSIGYFDRASEAGSYQDFDAGCSRFHPAHNHWHFDNFARYTLLDDDTGKTAGGSRKVSFCVIDTGHPFPDRPGSPEENWYPQDPSGPDPAFPTCSETSVDGLSIGWEDTYGASLPGQGIKISGLPRGRYCLLLETDPPIVPGDGGVLDETNEGNNARTIRVALRPHHLFVKRLGSDCRTPA